MFKRSSHIFKIQILSIFLGFLKFHLSRIPKFEVFPNFQESTLLFSKLPNPQGKFVFDLVIDWELSNSFPPIKYPLPHTSALTRESYLRSPIFSQNRRHQNFPFLRLFKIAADPQLQPRKRGASEDSCAQKSSSPVDFQCLLEICCHKFIQSSLNPQQRLIFSPHVIRGRFEF